jgi:ribosomal protein S12 methylthiotransferase accessory factor YcaO
MNEEEDMKDMARKARERAVELGRQLFERILEFRQELIAEGIPIEFVDSTVRVGIQTTLTNVLANTIASGQDTHHVGSRDDLEDGHDEREHQVIQGLVDQIHPKIDDLVSQIFLENGSSELAIDLSPEDDEEEPEEGEFGEEEKNDG